MELKKHGINWKFFPPYLYKFQDIFCYVSNSWVRFIYWVFTNAFLSWLLFYQRKPPMSRPTTIAPMPPFPPTTPLNPSQTVSRTPDRRGDSWVRNLCRNFIGKGSVFFLQRSLNTTAEEQRALSHCCLCHSVPSSTSWIKWQCFIKNVYITMLFPSEMLFSIIIGILKRDQENEQRNLGNRIFFPLGSPLPS